MKHLESIRASWRHFLRGRFLRPERQWLLRLEILWQQALIFGKELFGRKRSRDGGNWGFPPFAGKPAPVRPTSPSRLVAEKAMPPSVRTYLRRKD